MTEKRKALSYIRYSSLAQGTEGRNSTKRQQEALDAALAKWNLELDATFKDGGKSGYHQRHLAKGGAMHRLRNMALRGELRGKVIVIEDFDRAGRMQVMEASRLLADLLENGVDLVVGQYGGEYFSKEAFLASPHLFYRALDEMHRGFGESKRKTEMAKAKWKERLERIAGGKPVALNSLPFWLYNEKDHEGRSTGKISVKKGMRELICQVYAMYLAGEGGQVIANKLNAKGVPLPPRRDGTVRSNANVWHPTFIQKLIKNRALLGYYGGTDHRIFPVLIDEQTFYRANKTLKERIRFAGRKAEHVNPYSGLCFCAHCGGHLTRHSSRKNQATVDKYVYLQCRSSKRGKCSAAGMHYQRFEESFQGFLPYVDFATVKAELSEPRKTDEISVNLAHAERQISKFKAAMEAEDDPSKAVSLGGMLTKYDKIRAALLNELEVETIKERGATRLSVAHYEYLRGLFSKGKLQDPKTRLEIQEALRVSIERITIDVKTQSYTVTWKASPNVFVVELLRDGFKVSGVGCVNLKVTQFNLPKDSDMRKAA